MATLTERALSNEFNCKQGAIELLYSLAEHGLLKEPFRNWAAGFQPVEGKDLESYNAAILDLSESIIMFHDEIKESGNIL